MKDFGLRLGRRPDRAALLVLFNEQAGRHQGRSQRMMTAHGLTFPTVSDRPRHSYTVFGLTVRSPGDKFILSLFTSGRKYAQFDFRR